MVELSHYLFNTALERIFRTHVQERGNVMQKPRKTSLWLWAGYLTIAVLVLAICSILTGALFPQQANSLIQSFAPSCSIGVGSATVTVKGWHDDCQHMLAGGNNNFTGIDWSKYEAYAASEANGIVQCEFDLGGRHITIRDGGVSNTGSELCVIMRGP